MRKRLGFVIPLLWLTALVGAQDRQAPTVAAPKVNLHFPGQLSDGFMLSTPRGNLLRFGLYSLGAPLTIRAMIA